MKKALLNMLALLCLTILMSPSVAAKEVAGEYKLDASAFSKGEPLTLSTLPVEQKYNPEEQEQWWRKIPTTNNAVLGNYIQDSYNNASSPTTVTYMGQMTITSGSAANQVVINNFYGGGGSITGTVSAADGTLTIPSGQIIGYMDDGATTLRLYLADFSSNHYYNTDMVAQVSPRGIILMPQALIIATGTTNGQIRCYGDLWYKMNATQTDYSLWLDGDNAVQTYQVHFSRKTSTQILIKNFYGMGYPVNGTLDSVGKVTLPYVQVGVGQNATGSTIVVRNYNVSAINYNTTPPTPTCNTSATPATFAADSIVTGPYCVAGSTTTNRMDLVLKSVIRVQAADAFEPFNTSFSLPGSGTKDDPYRISTAEDLQMLSMASNFNPALRASKSMFDGKYFVQTADIDMDNIENFEPICADAVSGWGATYDGQGYKILNLKVDQSRGTAYRAGFIGEIQVNGVVKNLTFVNPVVSTTNSYIGTVTGYCAGRLENIKVQDCNLKMTSVSSSYCGGVTGYIINNAQVLDCEVTGTIAGPSYLGGIAGNCNGAKIRRCSSAANITRTAGSSATPPVGGILSCFTRDTTMIEDCVFTGTITIIGDDMVGGIVGQANSGQINRCWNAGQIMHSYNAVSTACIGGIAGQSKDAKINDCLSTGIQQSYLTSTIGSLVGTATGATAINGSLGLGTILCAGNIRGNELAGDMQGTSAFTNTYYDNQAGYRYGTENGLSTATLTSGQLPQGFNAEAWTVAAGKYPMLSFFANHERAALDRVPMQLAENENVMAIRSNFTLGEENGVTWYMLHNLRYSKEGNGLAINGNNVTVTTTTLCSDTIVALCGDYYRMIPVKVTPKEFDGEGTAESPYLIYNKADWDRVFKAVDVDLFDYSDTYFRLEGDIDFAGVTNFTGYSVMSATYAFNGVIDGNGHHIKNLVMNTPASSSTFGTLLRYLGPKSVIKNLTIDESCRFIAGSYAGFAAAVYGRLENIMNLAPVTALYDDAASIACILYNGAAVVNCYNGGEVKGGRRYMGGIVAQASKGAQITGCQNAGNVSGVNTSFNTDPTDLLYIGGIVGDGSCAITDCLNQGMISGYGSVGGIAGSFSGSADNQMVRCLNTGVLVEGEVNTSRGAIYGSGYTLTDNVKNCVFDSQMAYIYAGANKDQDGCSGLTTAELISGKAVEALGSDMWQYEAGKFPVLKAFASQTASQWYSSTIVQFATSPRVESRLDKRSDAILSLPAGTTASVADGEYFTVNGNTLSHTVSRDVLTDTLHIASADKKFNIKLPLFATPRLLDNGDGSAQNPWIINNANDWNILAQYSNEYGKGFDDEYFRLGADIDFASGFEPICLGNAVSFNGILDGDGKRIRNARYEDTTQKYLGLIGYAGVRSVIHDIVVDSTCFFTGNQYVGAVAGHTNGEVYNITNYSTVNTDNMQYAGGVVGELAEGGFLHHSVNYGPITSLSNSGAGGICGYTTAVDTRIEDCVNYGLINAKGTCGGIVGTIKGSIARCENFAPINSTSTNAAGICGYMWNTDRLTIRDCVNHGDVTGTGNQTGGIVAYMQGSGDIINCVNHGNVTSAGQYVGGILGTANTASSSWLLQNVTNYGNVTGTAYTGGVIGYSNSSVAATPAKVDSAANYGNVVANKTGYCGGIAGSLGNYASLYNVYNYGDTVSALTIYAGGVAGRCIGKIVNAYNHADVMAGSYSVGGICGETSTSTVTDYGCEITDVINVGSVKSTGTTDATSFKVGGILGYGRSIITNAVNMGDVSGRKSVGGIVGLPLKGNSATALGTQVYNSYNAARVECTASANAATCGVIMGDNTTAVTFTAIGNCYYDTQMAGTSLLAGYKDLANEGVTGLATLELMKASLGSGFTFADDAYPVPAALAARDFAALASAAVVLAAGENADAVKSSFRVTLPAGAVWSSPTVTFSQHGNTAWESADLNNRTPIYVALGNAARRVMLQLTSSTGVGSAFSDADAEVREVIYYNLNGIRIPQPEQGICIRVTVYKNGTSRSERVKF